MYKHKTEYICELCMRRKRVTLAEISKISLSSIQIENSDIIQFSREVNDKLISLVFCSWPHGYFPHLDKDDSQSFKV